MPSAPPHQALLCIAAMKLVFLAGLFRLTMAQAGSLPMVILAGWMLPRVHACQSGKRLAASGKPAMSVSDSFIFKCAKTVRRLIL